MQVGCWAGEIPGSVILTQQGGEENDSEKKKEKFRLRKGEQDT